MNVLERLKEMETLLRSGRGAEVRRHLQILGTGKIGRGQALRVANIARRVGMVSFALKVLSPIVRPKVKDSVQATEIETAEYALALIRIGAEQEGHDSLQTLSSKTCPESSLYRAFFHIGRWEYEDCIPLLENYLLHPSLTPYQKLVAKVNLASSLIFCKRDLDADAVLQEVYETTSSLNLHLLRANCLELRAQTHVAQQRFADAHACINEAATLLQSEGGQNSLLLKKWQINLAIHEHGFPALPQLRGLKHEAQKLRVWEVARDCDLSEVKITKDPALANRLYYGTAYAGYHRRLEQILPWLKDHLQPSFGLRSRESQSAVKGEAIKVLNVNLGRCEASDIHLKQGGVLHRFLISATRDFYKPIAVGRLFSEVFPNQFFDVHSSEHRIFQTAFRLRECFRKANFDLNFRQIGGTYKMILGDDVELSFWNETRDGMGRHENYWLKNLADTYGESRFSAKEAREHLVLSLTKMSRLIRIGLEEGQLVKEGNGKNSFYRVVRKQGKVG